MSELLEKAAAAWESAGFAPFWKESKPSMASTADPVKPQSSLPSTQTEKPVSDVSDRYVDTTPKSVPSADDLDAHAEEQRVKQATSPQPIAATSEVYCPGCEETHEAPACTTIPQRMEAMQRGDHPAGEGAVFVRSQPTSIDELMAAARKKE